MTDETIIKIIKKIRKNKNFSPCYTFNVSKIKGVNEIFFTELKDQILFCVGSKKFCNKYDNIYYLYIEDHCYDNYETELEKIDSIYKLSNKINENYIDKILMEYIL